MNSHRVATHHRETLLDGWQVLASPPGAITGPQELNAVRADDWVAAPSLGTAAAVLRSLKQWSLDGPVRRFDAEDWWYRVDLDLADLPDDGVRVLGFDGLATMAEVWLNGESLLHSDNMFVAHQVDVSSRLRPGKNELVLRFAALDAALAKRRPRPRWRTPMVEHQQLRWLRTTLLGRTPGWSPPAAAVGPWKDIWLERRAGLDLASLRLTASLEGSVGRVDFSAALRSLSPLAIGSVRLELDRAGSTTGTEIPPLSSNPGTFAGTATVEDAARWWPHTHGEPALYRCRLRICLVGDAAPVVVELGPVGFRSIEADTRDGGFALRVNGEPVFCRGACWTPIDVAGLRATPDAYTTALTQVRAAGMNMVRIGGTMVYEDDAFFAACDALGVLVWQDFMFANMDYPEGDAPFDISVLTEVDQQLTRWQSRPSLAVLCGNSEVEQQAAMWGALREQWAPPLFHQTLAARCRERCPGVPYWPSSAHGGAFPHQASRGTTSYYGVGAYLRPLDDARRADLRFATECLAFANVPAPETIARMPGGHGLRTHHPGWKARTPRDLNAGWDFEDVRDHYLAQLFRVDPAQLRYADPSRCLSLSRIVTGEVMAAAYAEWRRAGSTCGGALVWFLRDLWAGAGWGLLDDQGHPKACWRYLQRVLQPVAVFVSDEGTNGLAVHLLNERPEAIEVTLSVVTYDEDDRPVFQAEQRRVIAARSNTSFAMADLADGFLDLSYAYRFGPQAHHLVVTTLRHAEGILAQDFCFPAGRPSHCASDLGLTAEATRLPDGRSAIRLETRRFAQAVHFESANFLPRDEYFHMAPNSTRLLLLDDAAGAAPAVLKGSVAAVNWRTTALIQSAT